MTIADGLGIRVPVSHLTGRRCACGNCGELFNSLPAFDKHRINIPGTRGDRGCRDELEMIEAGMSVNLAGYWVTEAMLNDPFGGDENIPDTDPGEPVIFEVAGDQLPILDDPIMS